MGKKCSHNLIEIWIEVWTSIPGLRLVDAIEDLCADTGLTVTHSRVGEWRRGVRTPSPAAQRHMARMIAGRAVRDALGENPMKYSDEQLDRLADMFTPPDRVKICTLRQPRDAGGHEVSSDSPPDCPKW